MSVVESIVLTGGPCGGKSSALTHLKASLESRGWRVLIVPETATDLITSGVSIQSFESPQDFQKLNVKYMTEKHDLYFKAAEKMSKDKPTVIIFDRGINDCMTYAGKEALTRLLDENGLTPIKARDRYGAVFHLTTAADGAPDYYITSNNSARTETPEEAIKLDRITLSCWIGHPHLRIIGNDCDFNAKLKRLTDEIMGYLGIPEPLEVERKFLVRMPNLDELDSMTMCQKVNITQIYLKTPDGSNCRIRKRGLGDDAVYIKTEKRSISDTVREEIEERITPEEYNRLLEFADKNRKPIEKTRRLIVSNNKYFELDTFGFWSDRAILELELLDPSEPFDIPDFIEVIKEVTDDKRYNNSSLALQPPFDNID